jgi:hypothetical protein
MAPEVRPTIRCSHAQIIGCERQDSDEDAKLLNHCVMDVVVPDQFCPAWAHVNYYKERDGIAVRKATPKSRNVAGSQ